MKAKETFLDRNKKKSLLAALLLFLRKRKILVLLLLLVLAASSVFVSPSSWITRFPGGARFAGGVAWVAGKLGVDVSRWGLGPAGQRSYADLVQAFRTAKADAGRGNGVGWGPFFGRGRAAGGGPQNSLDLVGGKRSDLEGALGAGRGGLDGVGGNQTIKGVVDPAEAAKNKENNAVALGAGDLGGEREDLVKGFMNGLLGGPGAPGAGGKGGMGGLSGDAALSGGAYAGKGFFSGTGGAAGSQPGDLARSGLKGVGTPPVPTSKTAGAAKGQLSAMASRAVETRAMKGVAGAASLGGGGAFSQLAVGNGRAQLGTQYCQPPDCPAEYAAMNTGAIYDGNSITSGFLTSSDPGANSAGLISGGVNVPSDSTLGGTTADPNTMAACEASLSQCEGTKSADEQHLGALKTQINTLMGQLPGACGDPCNCSPCDNLQNQIQSICNGDIQATVNRIQSPCSLPASCNAMGISDPTASAAAPQVSMCSFGSFSCPHLGGFASFFKCTLGS